PKSNAAYAAINAAQAEVRRSGSLPVPLHLRNAPTRLMKAQGYGTGYRYAHDSAEGYLAQDYLPEALVGQQFYQPVDRGYEKTMAERLRYLQQLRQQNPPQP
ncbi:MAG: replication-associated recombination protein A, partial [Desulfuromonas thiophila]|nr:replication-associated recombination protein A [Desulfuromonas thiophila]